MENHFNYESVPGNFVHCFNHQCVKSDNCLRRLAAGHCTATHPIIRTVNPLCVPEDTGACPYYCSAQKMRKAWGIKHLLDRVPCEDAKELKAQMIAHFSKTSYYRYYRQEQGLSPEDQAFVRRIFKRKGIAGEPAFDHYTEEYIWR